MEIHAVKNTDRRSSHQRVLITKPSPHVTNLYMRLFEETALFYHDLHFVD